MTRPPFLRAAWILALLGGTGLRAEAPPLFSPEPPEPAAAALVQTYLPLLAAGQFDQALALNDLRGMRQYLLDRRLSEFKAKNPELTEQDLAQMSAQIQVNDLNPARLEDILRQVMTEAGYTGMTWQVRGYAPAPAGIEGCLVSIDARSAAGQEKPVLLGIRKLGDIWMVAPEVIEKLMGRSPVVRPAPTIPPPEGTPAAIDGFWKPWQAGELAAAYGLLAASYRAQVPLLDFLQQAQEAIARAGVPASWSIVQSREISPGVLGFGVDVQGSLAPMHTIMVFRKTGETWLLEGVQFRPPAPAAAAPAAPGPGSPLRSDLRPDLKPDLPAPAPAAAPAPP